MNTTQSNYRHIDFLNNNLYSEFILTEGSINGLYTGVSISTTQSDTYIYRAYNGLYGKMLKFNGTSFISETIIYGKTGSFEGITHSVGILQGLYMLSDGFFYGVGQISGSSSYAISQIDGNLTNYKIIDILTATAGSGSWETPSDNVNRGLIEYQPGLACMKMMWPVNADLLYYRIDGTASHRTDTVDVSIGSQNICPINIDNITYLIGQDIGYVRTSGQEDKWQKVDKWSNVTKTLISSNNYDTASLLYISCGRPVYNGIDKIVILIKEMQSGQNVVQNTFCLYDINTSVSYLTTNRIKDHTNTCLFKHNNGFYYYLAAEWQSQIDEFRYIINQKVMKTDLTTIQCIHTFVPPYVNYATPQGQDNLYYIMEYIPGIDKICIIIGYKDLDLLYKVRVQFINP